MTFMEWILSITLFSLYVVCLFTVCRLTLQKGHWVLGIIGIFAPWLWLIGAVLPARPNSQYAISQATQRQYEMSNSRPA
jgi:hypothetical protein